uniref:pyruvate kinase alpha/beta domain-containing protein n=1 Tax=Carboxydothermus ferrireducens TaxID=54265 RepID=UPI000487C891
MIKVKLSAGPHNTDLVLELAAREAREQNIHNIVVATCSGATAFKLLKYLNPGEFNLVAVTHHVGFAGPGVDELSPENRQKLLTEGFKVLTTTHLFAGIDRAFRFKFQGIYPSEIVAQSLRLLGQGVKVATEIAIMALDAGLIPYGEDVIAIAGTGEGADTAVVIRPAHSHKLFDTKIKKIIVKPYEF